MGEPEAPDAVEVEATNKYVVWDHQFNFQTRELTRKDLVNLGADPNDEDVKDLEWTPSNRWMVARADIPLTDIQLGGLLALEQSFRLVER